MAGHFLVVSVVCGKRSIRARAELRPKMGKKAELTSVQPRTGLHFISFHFSFRVEASTGVAKCRLFSKASFRAAIISFFTN